MTEEAEQNQRAADQAQRVFAVLTANEKIAANPLAYAEYLFFVAHYGDRFKSKGPCETQD